MKELFNMVGCLNVFINIKIKQMAITFKLIERKNPQDKTTPAKLYPSIVSNGTIDLTELSRSVSKRCSMTFSDVYAVIYALVDVIPEKLSDGKIVKLGDLGTFRLTLRSDGADSVDAFNNKLIKQVKVNYKQGAEFKRQLSSIKFSRAV